MKDIVRDSVVGQIINYLSNGRLLPYADQKPGYVVPEKYRLQSAPISRTATIADVYISSPPEKGLSSDNVSRPAASASPEIGIATTNTSVRTLHPDINATSSENGKESRPQTGDSDEKGDLEKGSELYETLREDLAIGKLEPDGEVKKGHDLVDWDGPDDPDNPRYADRKRLLNLSSQPNS
jgi:MFS transporter, DHA1 family, multidrug resistance protein